MADGNTDLLVRDDGVVRTLTLNRPDRRNALTTAMIDSIRESLDASVDNGAIRAVIITGAHPGFCSGLDLNELRTSVSADAERQVIAERFFDLLQALRAFPKPTVAAVNGPAAAGGATLASVCDCVLAGSSARIGYPGIRRGVTASVVIPLLIAQIGERRAKRLLLTGELVTADAAREMGMVDEVVTNQQLLARAREIALDLSEPPKEAFAETKRFINELLPGGAEHFERRRDLHSCVRLHAADSEAAPRSADA